MNAVLIFEAILATMDLVARIAESRGYEGEDLEAYITLRNKVRQAVVDEAIGKVSEEDVGSAESEPRDMSPDTDSDDTSLPPVNSGGDPQ